MNYEKKYKETLERAKECHTDGLSLHQPVKEVLEHIFPELAESEDEKIRKCIAYIVKCFIWREGFEQITKDKCLAWLEKQKESTFLKNIQIGDKVTRNEDGILVNLSQLDRVAKPADKVEPKFKKGDVVIWQDEEYKILDVNNDNYSVGGYILPIYRQCELRLKQKPAFDDTQTYLKGVSRVQGYEELSEYEKIFDRIADTYAHNKNKVGYNKLWYTKERAAEMLHWAKKELGSELSQVNIHSSSD